MAEKQWYVGLPYLCQFWCLSSTFVPHVTAGLPLQTQWFMQDGARPHTPNVVLEITGERCH
jgi:hypothetical protein